MNQELAEFQRNNGFYGIQMESNEIEYVLESIRSAPDSATMVEWGSGSSTVTWLQEMRSEQKLISIEHNPHWYDRVQNALTHAPELTHRLTYHLCEGTDYWKHGYGDTPEENPIGLDRYFKPDDNVADADIFFVDGVARGVCLMMALQGRKSDPVILLHDWAPRQPWYSWAVQLFPKVEQVGSTLLRLYK